MSSIIKDGWGQGVFSLTKKMKSPIIFNKAGMGVEDDSFFGGVAFRS